MRVRALGVVLVSILVFGLLVFLVKRDVTDKTRDSHQPPQYSSEIAPVSANETTGVHPTENDVGVSSISVSGHVQAREGRPIPGAMIACVVHSSVANALGAIGVEAERPLGSAVSDDSGYYSLHLQNFGAEYEFTCSAKGYINAWKNRDVGPDGITDLDFTLSKCASVSGKVLDVRRTSVRGAVVVLLDRDQIRHKSLPTDADGHFSLDAVLPDLTYSLGVRLVSGREGPSDSLSDIVAPSPPVTIKPAPGEHCGDIQLVLPCDGRRAVEGIVVGPTNERIPGVNVCATPAASATGLDVVGQAAPTDELGRFRISCLSVDFVNVHLAHADFEPTDVTGVAVPMVDLVVHMEPLSRGVINGVVLDAETEKPIENAQVHLHDVSREQAPRWRRELRDFWGAIRAGKGRVGDGGRFRIENVPVGKASLFVFAPGYGASLDYHVEVAAGEEAYVLVRLVPAGMLRIDVVQEEMLQERSLEQAFFGCRPASDPESDFSTTVYENRLLREPDTKLESKVLPPWEVELAPNTYDVVVFVQAHTPWQEELPGLARHFRHYVCEVRSGQTTDLKAEFGGTSVVCGSIAQKKEGEQQLSMVLVPAAFRDSLDGINPFIPMDNIRAVPSCGEMYKLDSTKNRYAFDCVAEGNYALLLYALNKDGTVSLRGSGTALVHRDEVVTVDLD